MNKKLIAAAIAAAMAAPAAYADATVYGQLKLWQAFTNDGDSMSSSGSRLGFKGSEDLGNGLKAVFKLEYSLNPEDGDTFGSRSQYVGLAGGFGTVMFGKRETNYLLSTAKLDMFGDTLADYNNTIGFNESGTTGNSRPNNAIHYVSPSFSGLSVSAGAYDHAESGSTFADTWDAAVAYKNGGIHASAAYGSGTGGADSVRIGLGYKMDALKVSAIYEDGSSTSSLWQIQGAYTMGNNTVKAMYGEPSSGSAFALAVEHKMSKHTKVYAIYADSDRALNADVSSGANDGFALGMQHNF